MAQYKVIQDIEAEDKLVGPLTLRQFIYAGISAVCLYICFLLITKGLVFLTVLFIPIALGTGFFAFPWRGEQPTEIWALARIRFSVKPRVRIWDQAGAKEVVTVVAPKKLAVHRSYKADMSQLEVRSRLKALADTIDSRGWATRNAAYGMYNQQWNPAVPVPAFENSGLSATIPSDDMFDDQSSIAQNFDAMLTRSQSQKRERVMQQMSQAQNPLAAAPQAAPQQQQYQPQPQQAANQQYAYNAMPELPTPIMQQPAIQPQYQPPAPAMQAPAANQQQTGPQENYWFASGPAYPTSPVQQPAQASAPTYDMQAQQQQAMDAVASAYEQPNTAAPSSSDYRIESDMPLATAATPTDQENAMGQDIKQQNDNAVAINYGHMRVLQPSGDPFASSNNTAINYQDSTAMPTPVYSQDIATMPTLPTANQSVTRTPDPAILELANNDDLNIDVLARQAKREIEKSPDEVEIRLH